MCAGQIAVWVKRRSTEKLELGVRLVLKNGHNVGVAKDYASENISLRKCDSLVVSNRAATRRKVSEEHRLENFVLYEDR